MPASGCNFPEKDPIEFLLGEDFPVRDQNHIVLWSFVSGSIVAVEEHFKYRD